MIEVNAVGKNSFFLRIQNESAASVISSLSNLVVAHGWITVAGSVPEFKAPNVDGTFKHVRLIQKLDPDLNQTIGTLCPVTNGIEELVPKRDGIYDRLNWFCLTSNAPLELWIFVSQHWLFITSKEGESWGRGIQNSKIGIQDFYKGNWYSYEGYYAPGTRSGTGSLGDYFVDPSPNYKYRYIKSYNQNYNNGYYYYQYGDAEYYDVINDYARKGEYEKFCTIQGITEIKPHLQLANPYLWVSTGDILNQDEVSATDYDYAVSKLVAPTLKTLRGLDRPRNCVGTANNSWLTCNLISEPLNSYLNPTIQVEQGTYTVSSLLLQNSGPLGRMMGLKLAQTALDLPFGSIIKLRTDEDYNLTKFGKFREFVSVPCYVHRIAHELQRTWVPYSSLTEVDASELPYLSHYYDTVDMNGNVVNTKRSNLWLYGKWDYQWVINKQNIHGSFLIPA